MANAAQPAAPGSSPELFPPTLWTVVSQAAGTDPEKAQAALARLCELYHRPIQICVRLRVADPHTAEDVTQQFIAHLLKPGRLANFERQPGSKFRSYLVKALENFLNDWRDKLNTQKRGGDVEHVPIELPTEEGGARPSATLIEPARVLDREVALRIQAFALDRLEEKFVKANKRDRFGVLKDFVFGDPPPSGHTAIAEKLGLTANAVRQELWRMRDHYYDLFRAEVAQIVGRPEDVNEEMHYLVSLLPDEYGPIAEANSCETS